MNQPNNSGPPNLEYDRVAQRTKIRFGYSGVQPESELLRRALENLTALMQDALGSIPPDEAEAVMSDLHTFLEESAKPEPRREWWQLARRGLLEAAAKYPTDQAQITRTIGEVGEALGDKIG